MAGKRKFSIADVKKAIEGSAGNVSLVAERLHCNRSMLYRYMRNYPEIAAAFLVEDMTVQGRPQYPLENFEKAIVGSHGIVAVVMERVGCSRGTVENAMERWPQLKDMLKSERESLVDKSESVIVKTLDNALDPTLQFSAAKYVTGTLGKERGWASRKELTGANGEALFAVPEDVIQAAQVVGIDLQQAWEKFLVMIKVQARQMEIKGLANGEAS